VTLLGHTRRYAGPAVVHDARVCARIACVDAVHLIPTDFFRYTIDGARVLLMDSGMDIEATYKIGNSAIASGFMLGFGAGDFDLGTIKKRLLQPVREPVGKSSSWGRMAESLYVGTCVVGRKPLRTR
jgi:hypothetical protein